MMLTEDDKILIRALKQGARLRAEQDTIGKATVIKKAQLIKQPYSAKHEVKDVPVSTVYKLLRANMLKVAASFPWYYDLTKKGAETV